MQELGTREIMDYTAAPVGLIIKGQLWTGQPTLSTATCPKCGRIGVISARQGPRQIIVHTGHVDGDTLAGIDYCDLGFDATRGKAYEESSHQAKTGQSQECLNNIH